MIRPVVTIAFLLAANPAFAQSVQDDLQPLRYNNPGLTVDLGVGLWAWPIPMDYDGDGDPDLVVSCPDKPYNGTYFFENPGDDSKMPVFKPAVKIGPGQRNIRVSFIDGKPHVLLPGKQLRNFRSKQFGDEAKLPLPSNVHTKGHKTRANQWHQCDFDGDSVIDVVIAVGDWHDYGWDDAWNPHGEWTNGPLRGLLYLAKNIGTNGEPKYDEPQLINSDGKPIETFGWPSPNVYDFDGDGDLDIICGEFLDAFTYFQNIGTRIDPKYAAGRRLTHDGRVIRMDLQMIVPSAIDWDSDGDVDLVVGDEDGRVAFVEHTGKVVDGLPQFLPPKYFRQQADWLKFGALATPYGFDWDGDGDDDIICGNTAGYIGFFENLGGGETPKWAEPQLLEADGQTIRIQAGPNGSIQGPCEAKWGYTTLSVADWDHDDRPDIIVNSIWGEVIWYRNVGSRNSPQLQSARPIEVEWPGRTPKPEWTWWNPKGRQLVTQWRTTPEVVDFNSDGLNDLVMLDHEGYLALFERTRTNSGLRLNSGKRVFNDEKGNALRLHTRRAGGSGRRKIHITDWDGDGRLDLLANSSNADLYGNISKQQGTVVLKNKGPVGKRKVAGHTSSPATVDFDGNGIRDLVVGAEDGHLYYLRNPRADVD